MKPSSKYLTGKNNEKIDIDKNRNLITDLPESLKFKHQEEIYNSTLVVRPHQTTTKREYNHPN